MLSSTFIENLSRIVPNENIVLNELMSRHTTFRVGGEAACLIKVSDSRELSKIITFLKQTEHDFFVLGNGSNLLVSDNGYDGVVLKLEGEFSEIHTDGLKLVSGAGVSLAKAAKTAMEKGLTGMEHLTRTKRLNGIWHLTRAKRLTAM